MYSIITGAGAGIGLSIVKGLLEAEAVSLVVAVDLVIDKLEVLAHSRPHKLVALSGDASNRLVNQKAIAVAIQTRGKLDCIILNAAVLRPVGHMTEINVEDWKRLIDINFIALVHAVRCRLILDRSSLSMFADPASFAAPPPEQRPGPFYVLRSCSAAISSMGTICLFEGQRELPRILSERRGNPGVVSMHHTWNCGLGYATASQGKR